MSITKLSVARIQTAALFGSAIAILASGLLIGCTSAKRDQQARQAGTQSIAGTPGTDLDKSYRAALTPGPVFSFSPQHSLVQGIRDDGHKTYFTLATAVANPVFYDTQTGRPINIHPACAGTKCVMDRIVWQGYVQAGTTKVHFNRIAY